MKLAKNELLAFFLVALAFVLARLKDKDILFMARNTHGLPSFAEVREFLNKDCELLSQFHDEIEGNYLVYRC